MSEANELKDCSFTTNGHNACNNSLADKIHGDLSGPEKHPAVEIHCFTPNNSFETNVNILDNNNVQSSHRTENASSSKHAAAIEHASLTMEDRVLCTVCADAPHAKSGIQKFLKIKFD